MVLISQRPGNERRIASVQFSPLPSLKDVERSLGALDCQSLFSDHEYKSKHS